MRAILVIIETQRGVAPQIWYPDSAGQFVGPPMATLKKVELPDIGDRLRTIAEAMKFLEQSLCP